MIGTVSCSLSNKDVNHLLLVVILYLSPRCLHKYIWQPHFPGHLSRFISWKWLLWGTMCSCLQGALLTANTSEMTLPWNRVLAWSCPQFGLWLPVWAAKCSRKGQGAMERKERDINPSYGACSQSSHGTQESRVRSCCLRSFCGTCNHMWVLSGSCRGGKRLCAVPDHVGFEIVQRLTCFRWCSPHTCRNGRGAFWFSHCLLLVCLCVSLPSQIFQFCYLSWSFSLCWVMVSLFLLHRDGVAGCWDGT